MNRLILVLIAAALVTGCAATIESRKKERAAAYTQFSPEIRQLVDAGQIKVGMSPDAVYIAWGPPAQVLQSENEGGAATIWVYEGGWMEEHRYWTRRQMQRYYEPRTYARAEVVFVNNRVKEWRTLPQPSS